MFPPVDMKRIDQISHQLAFSSFEDKSDPVHTRLLDLFWDDAVSDLNNTARCGLANNIHFLLMRDQNATMNGKRINADRIALSYHQDTLKKCHRTKINIADATKYNECVFAVCGALMGLRSHSCSR
jgi:hypothetical protein